MAKDKTELNRSQQARRDIMLDIKNHKEMMIAGAVASIFIAMIVSSWVMQYLAYLTKRQDSITFSGMFTAWARSPFSWILTLVLVYVIARGLYRVRLLFQKDYIRNEEDGYKEAYSHEYGNAHELRGKELDDVFVMSKNYDDIHGDILGIQKGKIFALRDDLLSFNRNRIIFGASRSGKSSAFILNDLIQIFRRGESVIVTDTKGDVYRDIYNIAVSFGYIVKVLNIKPDELKNSDGWEPLKYITIEDEIQAEVLARAVIENTLSGPMDYWATNEMNALKATLLLVATSEAYKDRRSMGEVVNIFADPATFNAKFAGLPSDNPAKIAFNNYSMCKDDIQGQILNGMSIRLSLLQNKYVKNIISHDEIDLVRPMKEKCIYFIIIPDTESTTKFLASMFFTQCFTAQVRYADSLNREQKKSLIPVRYELDEAKAIGKIPDFDKKISTFASRKITSTLAFQNYGQLETLYPKVVGVDGSYEDILANSATQILVKGGDMNTCKYFSDSFGQTTTIVENARYDKARTKLLDLHDQQGESTGLGQRPLVYPDRMLRMSPNEVYILIVGFGMKKLDKYICEKYNPYYLEHYKEAEPNKRVPEWRKQLIKEEKEASEMIEKSKKKSDNDTRESATEKQKPMKDSKAGKPAIKKTDSQKEQKKDAPQKPKRVTTPVTQKEASDSTDKKSAYDKAKENSWICTNCGEENFDTDIVCINCGSKRPKKRKTLVIETEE